MRRILKDLSYVPGIRGSMVVSHDGMVIAASLHRPLDDEKVAAMASAVIMKTRKALASCGLESFRRLTMVSSHGKMLFTDTGIAYLVVVMSRNLDLGPASIEIESAARRIRSLGEMRIA